MKNTMFNIIGVKKQRKQTTCTQGTGSLSPAKTSHSLEYICTLSGQDQATARETLISNLEQNKIAARMSNKYVACPFQLL